ncbi:HDIG domain-containing protein [Patescibacteria group bacterium]|nr:HDIG domain-containing protein [Patescibacteria group bacterium]
MLIPKEVKSIIKELEKAGYEAFVVGGCVRDLLTEKTPHDWDITTNAKPEEIQKVFPHNFYNNKFGTVTVITGSKDAALKEIEITAYRAESAYVDKRWPEKIEFVGKLEDDLARRDFTVNAIALKVKSEKLKVKSLMQNSKICKDQKPATCNLQPATYSIIDPFNGLDDIKHKIIRTVGDPDQRFNEDALRLMRAIRFVCQLSFNNGKNKPFDFAQGKLLDIARGKPFKDKEMRNILSALSWQIEEKTFAAIKKHSKSLALISSERTRDEFAKIILSEYPAEGVELLKETGLLRYIIPELEKGIGVRQNRHHIYTIYEHAILSLKYCPSPKLEVRLAALFHDIAKPETKRGAGLDATFYNHDIVGANVARRILRRLRFSNEVIEKTAHLVRNHMFFYNVDEVSEAGVRRLVKRVGPENLKDVVDLRIADRLGSGVPKAKPYKLRHLEYLIDKVSRDPISVKMLKINGNDIIKILEVKPSPIIGAILNVLLAEVLEDPKLNTKKYLTGRVKELSKLSLDKLKAKSVEFIEEKKEEVELAEKSRFGVK